MELKCKTVTTHNVNYNDLDAFIQHHTGRKDYEIVPLQEWNNDSQHAATIEPKLNEFDVRDYEAFKAGRHDGMWIWQTILCGLCKEGHLPAGRYVVEVSW